MGVRVGDLDGRVVTYKGDPDFEVNSGLQPVLEGRCACRVWSFYPYFETFCPFCHQQITVWAD